MSSLASWSSERDVWEYGDVGLFCDHLTVYADPFPTSGAVRVGDARLVRDVPTVGEPLTVLLPTPNPFHMGNTEQPDVWRARRLDVFTRTGTRHGPALSVVALSIEQGNPLTPDRYMPDEEPDQ